MRKALKYRIYLTNGQRASLSSSLRPADGSITRPSPNVSAPILNAACRCACTTPKPCCLAGKSRNRSSSSSIARSCKIQLRVDLAFKAFFRRLKEGEQEAGYPRFKGFGRYDSITYPQYGNGVRLDGSP